MLCKSIAHVSILHNTFGWLHLLAHVLSVFTASFQYSLMELIQSNQP